MLTLLALLGVQALFLVLGLGITSRVPHLRRTGWAVLLGPLVGHVALILFSLRLCVGFTTGGRAVLIASGLLTVITLLSPRPVTEAFRVFIRLRTLRALLVACVAAQILLAAAPIAVGIDTYNGYGNLDAWYYTTDAYLLKDLGYFTAVARRPFSVNLHTIGTATRVGPQFSAMLLSLLGVDDLVAYNLVLTSFLFLVPVTVAFVCEQLLGLDLRWTLLGVLLACAHSSLELVYCYQHLGHVFSLALTPLALSTFWIAQRERDLGLSAFAAVVGAGAVYAYWPTLPLLALPAAVLSVALVLYRRSAWRLVGLYATTLVLVALIVSPRVLADDIVALVGSKRFVTRNDPVMVAFNPYLTEDLLPLIAGLTESGALSGLWLTLRPEQYGEGLRTVAAYLVAASAFLGVVAIGAWSEACARRPVLPGAVAIYACLVAYVFRQEYGYGLYKLVSWTHVMVVLSFLVGLRAVWRVSGWLGPAAKALGAALILVYLWLNLATARGYASRSLATTTGRFVTLQNFSRNPDWRELESWAARHSDGPIVIGMHHHVAQYWASFRLRRARYAVLVPQDVLGAVSVRDQLHNITLSESPDPGGLLQLSEAELAQSKYFLDWAAPNDVTWNRLLAPPIEQNRTFRLYRLQDVQRFLSLYDGWHPFENYDPVSGRSAAFRWMKNSASLLLFRFPRQPVRLSMGLRAGIGADRLARTIRVTHRGSTVAHLKIEGSGRLLTEPFTPEAGLELLEIDVSEPSRPIPRKFGLWNTWVEQDPRHLSVGVYDVRVLTERDTRSAWPVASGVYSAEAIRRTFLYDGLHSDDWLGERFRIALPAATVKRIVVRGRLVHLSEGDLPFRIGVNVNGVRQPDVVLATYGSFSLEIDLPRPTREPFDWVELTPEHSLAVESSYTQGQDVRRISLQLQSLEIEGRR